MDGSTDGNPNLLPKQQQFRVAEHEPNDNKPHNKHHSKLGGGS